MRSIRPEFTVRQRHLLYKRALVIAEAHSKYYSDASGICWWLYKAIKYRFPSKYSKVVRWLQFPFFVFVHIGRVYQLFPELIALRPDKLTGVGGYWWPRDDFHTRIHVLKICIEKTQSEE